MSTSTAPIWSSLVGSGAVLGLVLGAALTAAVLLLVVYVTLVRPWHNRWGATDAEVTRAFPHDSLAPHPKMQATRGITIQAPVEAVWPWLAQLGCGRAGWYSYDHLDNGGVPSATSILPEFQSIALGDKIGMTPDGKMAMPVAALEAPHLMVLGGTMDGRGQTDDINDPALTKYFNWIIIILLEEAGAGATRLLIRNRAGWNPSLLNNVLYGGFIALFSFIMERKMLLGICQRAETAS